MERKLNGTVFAFTVLLQNSSVRKRGERKLKFMSFLVNSELAQQLKVISASALKLGVYIVLLVVSLYFL